MKNSTFSASVQHRLGILFPRLGSNHDGEVVATARAIERTLNRAGADLHDLSTAILRPVDVRPASDAPLGVREMATWLRDQADLNDWEAKFVRDVARRLRAGARLTDKQSQCLRRLFAKYGPDDAA